METQDTYLFNDKKKKEKSGNGFARFCKFLFFVIAFFLVILTILANMGGSNDMLRESVESFVSDSFGKRPVTVGVLHKMTFFPSVGVHARNVKVLSKPEEEGGYPVVKIGNIEVFMDFWSVASSQPKFKKLVIEDVNAIKGMFIPEEFVIDHIYVDHAPGEDRAELIGSGKTGVHDWSLNVEIDTVNSFSGKRFILGETLPFTLNIADVNFKGDFSKGGNEYFKFDDVVISNGDRLITVNLSAYTVSDGLLKVRGLVKDNHVGTEYHLDLLMDRSKRPYDVTGDITIENAVFEKSQNSQSDIPEVIARLQDVLGYGKGVTLFNFISIFEVGKNLNINVKFNDASLGDKKSSFEMPYVQIDGQRRVGPVRSEEGSLTLFPAVIFADKSDKEKAFIVMEGNADKEFASIVFPNISTYASIEDSIFIECGLGAYQVGSDAVIISDVEISTKAFVLKAGEQNLDGYNGYRDIAMSRSSKLSKDNVLNLLDKSYEFVSGQLREASPNPTKCDGMIKAASKTEE